jgi:hypothetical protein
MENTYFSWTIDRNPDYNILNIYNSNNIENYINQNDYSHDTLINMPEISSFINNIIQSYNIPETEDFIPFSPVIISPTINYNLETITISSEDDLNCCICMETKENPQICQLNCCHKFCSECVITYISSNRNNPGCPICRTDITCVFIQTEEDLEKFINI